MAFTVRDTPNPTNTGGTLSFIGTAANGDNTLKAATTRIKVTGMALFPGDATASAPSIKSGTTTVFGTVALDASGAAGLQHITLPHNPAGHFVITAGDALILNNTARAMSGCLSYVIE